MNISNIKPIHEKKIKERLHIILELVCGLKILYRDNSNDYQKSHIETIVGAGLWYVPNSMLWSKMISLNAVKSFDPRLNSLPPKLTKDHFYPRKVSAQKLLKYKWEESDDPLSKLYELYISQIGRFHYVTPKENRLLMSFQKTPVFVSPKEAYHSAGIFLIQISDEQLRSIKKHNESVIKQVISLSKKQNLPNSIKASS